MKGLIDSLSTLPKRSLDKVTKTLNQQPTLTITAHLNENGVVDCVCTGSTCVASGIVSEEDLPCKRLQWLFMGEVKGESKEEREAKGDYPGGMFRPYGNA